MERVWLDVVKSALDQGHWQTAEGALRRLLLDQPRSPMALDLLGYSLLMQGQALQAEHQLRLALRFGSDQFWTPHKLGDALRAQQKYTEAANAYEQALRWGSDSPLTARNLLQVLVATGDDLALNRLALFASQSPSPLSWNLPLPWQLGAIDATSILGHVAMSCWLCQQGCFSPLVRRIAFRDALSRLDMQTALSLLAVPSLPSSDPSHQVPQCFPGQLLRLRLEQFLGLTHSSSTIHTSVL